MASVPVDLGDAARCTSSGSPTARARWPPTARCRRSTTRSARRSRTSRRRGQNPHASMLVRASRSRPGPAGTSRSRPRSSSSCGATSQPAATPTSAPRSTELAAQLRRPADGGAPLPPAVVLISDGMPTDDWEAASEAARRTVGARSVRMAVGIGRDADSTCFERFIGRDDVEPVTANNPEQLAQMIRWASTVASRVASVPVVPIPRARSLGSWCRRDVVTR